MLGRRCNIRSPIPNHARGLFYFYQVFGRAAAFGHCIILFSVQIVLRAMVEPTREDDFLSRWDASGNIIVLATCPFRKKHAEADHSTGHVFFRKKHVAGSGLPRQDGYRCGNARDESAGA